LFSGFPVSLLLRKEVLGAVMAEGVSAVETADGIPVARMALRKPHLLLGVRQQHRGRIQGRQVHASSHVSSMALTVSMMSMTN
jgi:hypothetical protein